MKKQKGFEKYKRYKLWTLSFLFLPMWEIISRNNFSNSSWTPSAERSRNTGDNAIDQRWLAANSTVLHRGTVWPREKEGANGRKSKRFASILRGEARWQQRWKQTERFFLFWHCPGFFLLVQNRRRATKLLVHAVCCVHSSIWLFSFSLSSILFLNSGVFQPGQRSSFTSIFIAR